MNKLQILYEYDKSFFTYGSIENDLWRDLLHKDKKESKIFFDLENDYSKHVQRVIEIPQTEWSYSKCKFRCEMYNAGGDWEIPVVYFKCQLIEGRAFGLSNYGNSHFVYIPGKTEGNYHLIPGKDNSWTAPNNDTYKKDIDPKVDEKKCWDSLKEYLKVLVDKEIENIKLKREENNDSI